MNGLPSALLFGGGVAVGVAVSAVAFRLKTKAVKDEEEEDDDEEWESEDDDSDDGDVEVSEEGDAGKGNLKMVLVVRTDLKMGKGKAAAQCAHAAVAAYKMAREKCPNLLRRYEREGQPKVVVKVETEEELLTALGVARSLGLVSTVISDAGRTQIAAGSRTVVAVGPAGEKAVDKATGHMKLY